MKLQTNLPVPTIEKTAGLRAAAHEMKRLDTGVLLVRDGQTVTGLVTDRDLVIRGLADPSVTFETTIDQLSTGTMYSCKSSHSLEEAAEIMEKNSVRYLLVMSPDNEALGVLSLETIAAQPGSEKLVGDVVAATTRPAPGADEAT